MPKIMKLYWLLFVFPLTTTVAGSVFSAASHAGKNDKVYTVCYKKDTLKTNKTNTLESVRRKSKEDKTKLKYPDGKKLRRSVIPHVSRLNPHPSDDDCVFTIKYTAAQRLKKYPFSKAAKIEAVSFRYMDRRRDYLVGDSVKIYDDSIRSKLPDSLLNKYPFENKYESGLHVENQKLNYSSLIEIHQLNSKEIKDLTNLIFNTTYKKITWYAHPGYSCYEPRNALIFYDHNGKIYDYLEICFECKQFRSLSDRVLIGSDCNQKFDLLKKFFIDLGIYLGTIKKG